MAENNVKSAVAESEEPLPVLYMDLMPKPHFHLSPDRAHIGCRSAVCVFDGEYHIFFFSRYDHSDTEHFSTVDFVSYTRHMDRKEKNPFDGGYAEMIAEAVNAAADKGRFDFERDFEFPCVNKAEDGRYILTALAASSDNAEGDCNMTAPREIICTGGKIIQSPIKELEILRRSHERFFVDKDAKICGYEVFEAYIKLSEPAVVCAVDIFGCAELRYCKDVFSVSCSCDGAGNVRPRSKITLKELYAVRILWDVSSLEVFLNDGEAVFTSKIYPKSVDGVINFFNMTAWVDIWKMGGIEVNNESAKEGGL